MERSQPEQTSEKAKSYRERYDIIAADNTLIAWAHMYFFGVKNKKLQQHGMAYLKMESIAGSGC